MEPRNTVNLKDLMRHIGQGLPQDEIKRVYRTALTNMMASKDNSSDSSSSLASDFDEEQKLCKKVEKQLHILKKGDQISKFNQLYRQLKRSELQSSSYPVINFLLKVSEKRHGKYVKEISLEKPVLPPRPKYFSPVNLNAPHIGAGDGLVSQVTSGEITVRPTSLTENAVFRKGSPFQMNSPSDFSRRKTGGRTPDGNCRGSPDSLSLMSASPRYIKCSKQFITESTILEELMYCFQGVSGNIIKSDLQQGFFIDPKVRIQHSSAVERLIQLGYLHNRVVSGCKDLQKNGSVAQAVEASIRKQLTNYYGHLGCMHSELLHSTENNDDTPLQEEYTENGSRITLRRLLLWVSDPMRIMQGLCDALSAITNKRGGSILNCLDRLRHHGDPKYQNVIQTLFDYAGKPIMSMIRKWVVEGELYDPHDEFFITINSDYHDRDIWRDKFILRKPMIPNVISHKLADTILRAGKAIHFLNVICEQRVPVRGMRRKLQNIKEADLLDLTDTRSELSNIVNGIFEETSQLVLETLVNKFKLFQHFQGLRRYILLGQGDFTNYFMGLIEPEMRKPASALRYHELMGLLGSAVRATTAAYEDPEIMKRVSVKLLVASGGDWGSDVFGLQYIMEDPLGAVFGISDGSYSHMFNFLWCTKRMEYILFKMRKTRWAIKNKLSELAEQIPEINPALILADRLSQELVHFARQFHYYILFEVVESLWEKFSSALQKATSLDDIITAHNIFKRDIQAQTFQDEASMKFTDELRHIWELVFELETLETNFCSRVEQEWEERGEWRRRKEYEGTNYEEELQFEEMNKRLKLFLQNIRAQYNIIIKNYQEVLKKFLLELSKRRDYQLRMLCARIDFNEHYKKNDARLLECMKFSRCGGLMFH